MNVAHALRRGAYGGGRGAGEGAEELSAWGDFAEVGEERLFK